MVDTQDDKKFLDDAEAHTLAKHKILGEYLKGWLPILARGQRNRLLYFDGFAGCGELTKGHPGSPLVAIRAAVGAAPTLIAPLKVQLVERDSARCEYLRSIVEKERAELGPLASKIQIDNPVCASCEDVVTELLTSDRIVRPSKLGPAFFFLDQYGYSGVSMDLIRRILSHEMCETFAYLNWQRMHPYFTDPTKADTFTRALGGDEWRQVAPLREQERVDRFKTIYTEALRSPNRGNAKYVYDFAMRGPDHRLIYWLFFCTNSIKGLEVMKKAMWKVDPSGRFEFSDRDENQGMLTGYTQKILAGELDGKLRGRTLSSDELKEHVLTQTPEYRFDEAVTILKQDRRVKETRRSGKTEYTFSPPPAETGMLFQG